MKKVDRIFHTASGTLKDFTANLISAPAQIRAKRAMKQADKDVATIKRARSYDRAPSYDDKGITNAGMARSLAQDVKDRVSKRYKK